MAPPKTKPPTRPDPLSANEALEAAPDVFAPEANVIPDLPDPEPIVAETAAIEAASDAAERIVAALEVPSAVAETVEDGMHLAKEAQDAASDAVQETSALVEDSLATASEGLSAFGRKAFENTRANTQAYLEHVTELLAVRSIPEAFELNATFARAFAETLSVQAKEFGELAQRTASEAAGTLKSRFVAPFRLVA